MRVYRGVVQGNVVMLDEPTDLPDGAEVEVRLVSPAGATADEEAQELAFKQHLLETGLLTGIAPRRPDPSGTDRTPVKVTGGTASQKLIEDRR